jgi:hypothetical protein
LDDKRFDQLARMVGKGASRRSIIKGLLGLGGSAIAGTVVTNDADARFVGTRPTIPPPPPPACPSGQAKCNGICCPYGRCFDGVCCPDAGSTRCGAGCCPAGRQCTTDGDCCPAGQDACGAICCPDGTCARSGNTDICCVVTAQNPGAFLCGLECCASELQCCDGECCPAGTVCLTRLFPEGPFVEEEICCPIARTCDNRCCPEGQVCCPGTAGNLVCFAGTACPTTTTTTTAAPTTTTTAGPTTTTTAGPNTTTTAGPITTTTTGPTTTTTAGQCAGAQESCATLPCCAGLDCHPLVEKCGQPCNQPDGCAPIAGFCETVCDFNVCIGRDCSAGSEVCCADGCQPSTAFIECEHDPELCCENLQSQCCPTDGCCLGACYGGASGVEFCCPQESTLCPGGQSCAAQGECCSDCSELDDQDNCRVGVCSPIEDCEAQSTCPNGNCCGGECLTGFACCDDDDCDSSPGCSVGTCDCNDGFCGPTG